MTNKKSIWFKKRTYGWGWQPANGKGVIATVLFLSLILIYPIFFDIIGNRSSMIFYVAVYVPVLSMIYLSICYFKGEKPGWQWGDKK